MIRTATYDDWDQIFEYISKDFARNYFVALGMLRGQSTFKEIYIEETDDIQAILFYRASGNLQFVAYEDYDVDAWLTLMNRLPFKRLIAPKSYCKPFEKSLIVVEEGALISELSRETFIEFDTQYLAKKLMPNDVDRVEQLYKTVFKGHPSAAFMKEKLIRQRGIGYCIQDDEMMAVAQSEFGYVIVGVATQTALQGKGYATSCLVPLIKTLFKYHTKLYLQYDNPLAGRLYEKMGFKPIDQVNHYTKR